MSAIPIPIRKMSDQERKDAELLAKFEIHKDFSKIFFDGYLLLNSERKIIKFNQAFCAKVNFDVKAIVLKKNPSAEDVFDWPLVDESQTVLDVIMKSTDATRIDELLLTKKESEQVYQVILGSYPFFNQQGEFLGVCLLMRNVTAEVGITHKYTKADHERSTDPLTGLYVRRFFEAKIDEAIAKAKEINQPPAVGILMFDLDKFKSINDTYGHQAGDFVLVETAKLLLSVSRKTDIVGRYGGEEILAAVFGGTAEGCCIVAEKFRIAIEQHEYIFEGKRIPVSTSVGVTMITDLNDTRDSAVARADKCLYAAKANGRNVVYCHFGDTEKRVTPEGLGGRPDLGAAGFGH